MKITVDGASRGQTWGLITIVYVDKRTEGAQEYLVNRVKEKLK